MLTELLMQDERREGRIEGQRESLLIVLETLGSVQTALQEQIMQEEDLDRLTAWVKLAAKSKTLEQFLGNYQNI